MMHTYEKPTESSGAFLGSCVSIFPIKAKQLSPVRSIGHFVCETEFNEFATSLTSDGLICHTCIDNAQEVVYLF